MDNDRQFFYRQTRKLAGGVKKKRFLHHQGARIKLSKLNTMNIVFMEHISSIYYGTYTLIRQSVSVTKSSLIIVSACDVNQVQSLC